MQIEPNEVSRLVEALDHCCQVQTLARERCCAAVVRVGWGLVVVLGLIVLRLMFVYRW